MINKTARQQSEQRQEMAALEEVIEGLASVTSTQTVDESRLEEVRQARTLPANKKTGEYLRQIYSLYSDHCGRERLRKRIWQEVGQRRRSAVRVLPDAEPEAVVGWNHDAVRDRVMELAKAGQGVLVVPNRTDKALVGRPTYSGGNPPSPFQWCPAMFQFAGGGGVVWELGPGATATAELVGQVLGRRVHMVVLPTAGEAARSLRQADWRIHREVKAPQLVLVPLPLPADRWSIRQNLRLLDAGGAEYWNINGETSIGSQHPEFSLGFDDFVVASLGRLQTLKRCVEDHGTKVCVTVPMVARAEAAIDKAIRKNLGWQAIARYTIIQEHGTRHIGDGSPIAGERMTVWGAAR